MKFLKQSAALLLLFISTVFSQQMPDSLLLKQTAPDSFKVTFETSKGNFVLMAYRNWSPMAVDRFYQLVKSNYYDSVVVFRVVTNFVVQFGITNYPALNSAWTSMPLMDEPVATSNKKGTVSFARGGKNSRTTQIFINLNDNDNLDNMNWGGAVGFPPFAKIIEGWSTVEQFYSGYGDNPTRRQGEIQAEGMTFTNREFPLLDYIKKAYLTE